MYRFVILFCAACTAFAADGDRTADGVAATGATAPPASAPSQGWGSILLFLMIPAFMYFILIRPQRKEEKRKKALIAGLKRGDQVVTIGGLHGEVVAVGETTIDVKAGEEGREIVLRFTKSAVQANTAAAVVVKDAT